MLQFRTAEGRRQYRPPNYLGHAFQRPAIILFLLVMVVLFVARGGGDKWAALFDSDRGAQQAEPEQVEITGRTRSMPPGAVVLQGEKPVASKQLFGGVDPKLFAELTDDGGARIGACYFTALKALADADQADIRAASIGPVAYAQLNSDSDAYRGEIVTVKGLIVDARKATFIPSNSEGIKKYHEIYVAPSKAVNFGMTIICLDLPENFPAEGFQEKEVEVDGFFYKMYKAADDEPDQPKRAMLLAKTVRLTAPPTVAANDANEAGAKVPGGLPQKYVPLVIGLGAVVLIFLAAWSYRLSKTSVLHRGPIIGRARREAEAAREPTDLNSLKIDS